MRDTLRLEAAAVKSRIEALLRTYPELAGDSELLLDGLEGQTDLYALAEKIIDARAETESFIVGIKDRQSALSERRDRFERRSDGLKSLLRGLMDAAGVEKLLLPAATISATSARPSVVVTEPGAVPSQLCRREPDKSAILTRLKAGEAIPGAALQWGEPSITIRTK